MDRGLWIPGDLFRDSKNRSAILERMVTPPVPRPYPQFASLGLFVLLPPDGGKGDPLKVPPPAGLFAPPPPNMAPPPAPPAANWVDFDDEPEDGDPDVKVVDLDEDGADDANVRLIDEEDVEGSRGKV